MKHGRIAALLCAALMIFCGCKAKSDGPVAQSENFTFSREMTLYQLYCDKLAMGTSMAAESISAQSLAEYTADNIKKMLVYCEAAKADGFSPNEGMLYRAKETVSYISAAAENAGMSTADYVRATFGEEVTIDAIRLCVEMYVMCEGYEESVILSHEVSDAEGDEYAENHPDDFLKYDLVRYSTSDEKLRDALKEATTPAEFANAVLAAVPALSQTDSDKSGIPDALERSGVTVSDDGEAGKYFAGDGRAVGDTFVETKSSGYTVTMAVTLPHRIETPTWDFRMVKLTDARSEAPGETAQSLYEQWLEKEGGEDGIAALAARYSDDPTAYSGGLMLGTTYSDMPCEEVAAWVRDPARAVGDATAISASDGCGYLLYFKGSGTPVWLHDAKDAVTRAAFDAKIAEFESGIGDSVTVDYNAILALAG